MSKSDGGTSTTIEDNDGNQLVHNSVFTNGSCLYFGTSAFINFSQADWDIRNNILYTQNNSGAAACLNFQSNSNLNATDNLRYCNANLFYNAQNDPTKVAKIGTNFYALTTSGWSSSSMSSILYVNNDAPNDINSFFYAPNWENRLNCDLDLLPDAFWPSNYPNMNYNSANGLKFIYGNLTDTDIREIPARTNMTIGAFEAGSSTILPVTLVRFEAMIKAGVVHICWQISESVNHAYFEVERSVDGSLWNPLARIQELHGTYNFKKDYYTTDVWPAIGNNYYRLKQVDTDGKYSYSVIRLVVNGDGNQLRLFPNPAKNRFLLSGLKKGMSHQIRVMDIAGKLIHSTNTSNTVHSIELPVSTTGMYLIQVDGKEYLRLVVMP
jgi:hypothetical protein